MITNYTAINQSPVNPADPITTQVLMKDNSTGRIIYTTPQGKQEIPVNVVQSPKVIGFDPYANYLQPEAVTYQRVPTQNPEIIQQQINPQPQYIQKENRQEILGRILQQYNKKSQYAPIENQQDVYVQQHVRYPSNERARRPLAQSFAPQQENAQRVYVRERSESPQDKIAQKYNQFTNLQPITETRKESDVSSRRLRKSSLENLENQFKRIDVQGAYLENPKTTYIQNQLLQQQNGKVQLQPQIVMNQNPQLQKNEIPHQIQYMSIQNQVLMDQLNRKIQSLEHENKDLRVINEQQQVQIMNNIDCIVKISRELKGVKSKTGYQDDFRDIKQQKERIFRDKRHGDRRSESPRRISLSPRKSSTDKNKLVNFHENDDDQRIMNQYQNRLKNQRNYQSMKELNRYDEVLEYYDQDPNKESRVEFLGAIDHYGQRSNSKKRIFENNQRKFHPEQGYGTQNDRQRKTRRSDINNDMKWSNFF